MRQFESERISDFRPRRHVSFVRLHRNSGDPSANCGIFEPLRFSYFRAVARKRRENQGTIKVRIEVIKNDRGLQGFSVRSRSSHGGGLHHGLGRTKVGAWMPRTVGVVLAH